MKLIKRKSSARWYYKNKANGNPQMLMDDRTLLKHAYNCRFPVPDRTATGAAELLAAAHALSFTMSLATDLGRAKTHRGHIQTIATVTLENWAPGWTVTKLHLDVLARLPELSQCDFIDATIRAKTGCFVSRLTKRTVSMNAKLQPSQSSARGRFD